MTTVLHSLAFIAADLERPVRDVRDAIHSLDVTPVLVLSGTAYYSTAAASAVEEMFGREDSTNDQ